MLELADPIKARLQGLPQLTGWAVRTNLEDADRSATPAADVRCVGAALPGDKRGAMTLRPAWQVTLVVDRSPSAAGQISGALRAVLHSLHGWQPQTCDGLEWGELSLQSITEPMVENEGLVGYELTFATVHVIKGQQ